MRFTGRIQEWPVFAPRPFASANSFNCISPPRIPAEPRDMEAGRERAIDSESRRH